MIVVKNELRGPATYRVTPVCLAPQKKQKNNGKTLEPRTWFDLARDPIINFGRFFYLFCLVPFVSPPPPNTAYVLYIFVVTACSVTWTLLYRAH
jgi:hypothetical protein